MSGGEYAGAGDCRAGRNLNFLRGSRRLPIQASASGAGTDQHLHSVTITYEESWLDKSLRGYVEFLLDANNSARENVPCPGNILQISADLNQTCTSPVTVGAAHRHLFPLIAHKFRTSRQPLAFYISERI